MRQCPAPETRRHYHFAPSVGMLMTIPSKGEGRSEAKSKTGPRSEAPGGSAQDRL